VVQITILGQVGWRGWLVGLGRPGSLGGQMLTEVAFDIFLFKTVLVAAELDSDTEPERSARCRWSKLVQTSAALFPPDCSVLSSSRVDSNVSSSWAAYVGKETTM